MPWGLVNRGYDTYVAPSLGESLKDTSCESCGLCISTCPTGAITENVLFKPGPVKMDKITSICNYCSIGCEIEINHKNQFVMRINGSEGMVNKDGNICKYPKFGYNYLNRKDRITKPVLKENGEFKEISFKKAYEIIKEKIGEVQADENAFFAGARLTNEELYLIQKFARGAVKTNNVTSFHYLNRGKGYVKNSTSNVPFNQLEGASRIYLIGSEINMDNAVAGFMINKLNRKTNIPVELVTAHENSSMKHKADNVTYIKSLCYFLKAVNYYLVANNFHNGMFIGDHCNGFEEYKEKLLKENFVELVHKSGVPFMDQIVEFAKKYNNEMNAVIVFSEKEISSHAAIELFNLSLITGKLGKTSSGLLSLKEKNNSQGLFDMGICPSLGTGAQEVNSEEFQKKMKEKWQVEALSTNINESLYNLLESGKLKNIFIFGEDPMGCALNKVQVSGWLSVADFVVVQDYFMTETTKRAQLILPATLPFETGGSFTNTQKTIQEFEPEFNINIERKSYEQLTDLLKSYGLQSADQPDEIRMEAFSLLGNGSDKQKLTLVYTNSDDKVRLFEFGCDHINAIFEKEFKEAFDKEY